MSYRILMIDDENMLLELINSYSKLNNLNYSVEIINSNKDIQEFLFVNSIDLIIISWILINKSSLSLIQEIKLNKATSLIPIIISTRTEDFSHQIEGLDQGADNFFFKDSPLELLFSKINAILRKENKEKNEKINLMRIFFFIDDALEVEYKGRSHKLTKKEFLIFKTLVNNPRKTFSQESLNKITSGEEMFISKRCIDTFVAMLRKKIGAKCILSIRKKGYTINTDFLDKNFDN